MSNDLAVGIALPLHSEFGHHILQGALRYAEEHRQIRLVDFCYLNDEPRSPRKPPPWTGRVRGVVLAEGYNPGVVSWIRRGGVPVVNAGGDLSYSAIASVFADWPSLVRTGVEHLFGLGYRNFAYVGFAKAHGSRRRRATLAEELKTPRDHVRRAAHDPGRHPAGAIVATD